MPTIFLTDKNTYPFKQIKNYKITKISSLCPGNSINSERLGKPAKNCVPGKANNTWDTYCRARSLLLYCKFSGVQNQT